VTYAERKWYLDWLQQTINVNPNSKYTVKLDSKIDKDPLSRAKKINIIDKTEITHIFDYESSDDVHVQLFKGALDRMKQAESIGKSIKYKMGYNNFTFELWIILHMAECNGPLTHRRQYLTHLNKAYSEHFEDLVQYKHKDNFHRVLRKISLDNVRQAILRSKAIMYRNDEDPTFILQNYKGYNYYRENPSLLIWETIEKILTECNLL
jgi:hypothetical protein